MRVLLTGAAGFVGSHVARVLIREGCEVHAIVRETTDCWRIEDVTRSLHLHRCDLLEPDEVRRHVEKVRPELAIHLAWHAEPGKYLAAPDNLALLNASLQLASHLAAQGCRRFVGTGTCFEYDTDLGYLSETSPTKPRSLYAASKAALQLVLEQLGRLTDMEVAWARLFYLYGPFEDERRLIPSVILALLRDREVTVTASEQVRDYLHVEDVATAIWAVAKGRVVGPVNVGSGRPWQIRDLVDCLGRLLGKPELIRLGTLPHAPSDPRFVCADNRKLRETTDWVPRVARIEEGLRESVEWWRRRTGLG